MNNCSQCGTVLRKGAKFCSDCGAVVESNSVCPVCGTEVDKGERFCFQCGAQLAPLTAPASAAAAKPARTKTKARADVKGFYKRGETSAISVSGRALVWSTPQGNLYRLGRDKQLLMARTGRISILDTMQAEDGIAALIRNYKDNTFELLTLTDDLRIRTRKMLWQYRDMPDVLSGRTFGLVNDRFAGFAWPNRGYTQMHFLRVSLADGSKSRFEVSRHVVDVAPLGTRILMTPDGKIFFSCMKRFEQEGGTERCLPIWMYVDFTHDQLGYLWREKEGEDAAKFPGKPEFFDFAKGVMWCGREDAARDEYTLTPCRISDGTPLPQAASVPFSAYLNDDSKCGFCYFDGKYAYFSAVLEPESKVMPPWISMQLNTVVWPQRGMVVSGDDFKWELFAMDGTATGEVLKVIEIPEIE